MDSGDIPESKPAPKSTVDLAVDRFFTLREDPQAKPGPERFQKVIAAGVSFITEYPTHPKAQIVIAGLATFGRTIQDKKLAALRGSFLPALKFEIVNQRYNSALGEDARAAVAALDAAAAGAEVREQFDRDTLGAYREKIDTLATQPGGGRFLLAAESDYLEVLKLAQPRLAEPQARKLLEHSDPKIVAMAKGELNLIEVRKQPFELKFVAHDGREVDFAKLRGKVVVLVFWSAANEGSINEQLAVKEAMANYSKQVEVIGVVCDKAEDREKVLKVIKDRRLTWAHHFDGNGQATEFVQKLNIRDVPTIAVFDGKGMFVGAGIRANKLEGEVKRLLAIK